MERMMISMMVRSQSSAAMRTTSGEFLDITEFATYEDFVNEGDETLLSDGGKEWIVQFFGRFF